MCDERHERSVLFEGLTCDPAGGVDVVGADQSVVVVGAEECVELGHLAVAQRNAGQLKLVSQDVPTISRRSLIPSARLVESPGSVPRSRMPSWLVQRNAWALKPPPEATCRCSKRPIERTERRHRQWGTNRAGATDQIVLTWVDGRDGLNDEHVFFTTSTDGGNYLDDAATHRRD
jgi:hypothetical protein